MKPREVFEKVREAMPWNAWRKHNSAQQTVSMSDGSFADWLRANGKRRGVWSEITYFTCLKTLAETMGMVSEDYATPPRLGNEQNPAPGSMPR